MVLTLVVCKILIPGEIFDFKVPLGNFISNPKEPHFHQPETLPFDGIFDNANCGVELLQLIGVGG